MMRRKQRRPPAELATQLALPFGQSTERGDAATAQYIDTTLRALTPDTELSAETLARIPRDAGLKTEYTARERAALRGWSVEPSVTRGPGHTWLNCQCKRRGQGREHCPCYCHGRAYVHYRRGG
jgi:hypothetical protein